MTDDDRQLAELLKERLVSAAGPRIRRVIVYGSRARGDGLPASDMDVAVIVGERTAELDEALSRAAYEVMWQRGFSPIISLRAFGEAEFEDALRQGFSFYEAVLEEGVVL